MFTGPSLDYISNNDTVYAVWNTIAGGDSTLSTSGSGIWNYFPGETAQSACDNNITIKNTSFGPCNASNRAIDCGSNTGFYRTLSRGPSLITALQVCTENANPPRDPMTITFEGSNQLTPALNIGSSWTLIYNGPSGLVIDPGRRSCGIVQSFSGHSVRYSSYRFLVTLKRSNGSSVSYADVKLFGD